VASAIGSGSDSIRTSMLLLVVCRWIQGSGIGVGIGNFAGAGFVVARPRRGAWPRCRAAPFVACETSIGCASLVECQGGVC